MTLKRDWQPSPNYSSRGGSGVRLVIVHTAEGATTYQALGNFFGSTSAGVSSHVGIDDTPGRIGEYVKRGNKAWTAGDANPYSVNVELCGFAAWGPGEWERHPAMLDNCARWIAEECRQYGIPIVKSNQHGVCGHVDVSGPGGHYDPGVSFPWGKVLDAAKNGGPVYGPPPPPPRPLLGRVAIYDAIGDARMPADYIIHDTSEGFPGSGNYYGVWASGLCRRTASAERQAMGDVAVHNEAMSKENSNVYYQLDQAARGFIAERK